LKNFIIPTEKIKALWLKVPRTWRFAIVVTISARVVFTLWSWAILSYFPQVIQNTELFGERIVTVFELSTNRRYIYNRQVGGRLLDFVPLDAGRMGDLETGSVWSVEDGLAQQGYFAGQELAASGFQAEQIFPYKGVPAYSFSLLAIWQRFDANWYLSIAQYGYGHHPGDVHFPPLYPLLIRLLSGLGVQPFLAGLLISHVVAVLMLQELYTIFLEWTSREVAQKAIFLFLLFPTSFFFFSAYTETLFIFFAIVSLREMGRQRWLLSGLWMFAAILTRLQGIVLVLPYFYIAWNSRHVLKKGRMLAGLAFPSLAVAAYMLLRVVSGDVVLPFEETELYARIVPPWESLMYAVQFMVKPEFSYIDALNLIVTVLFAALLWRGFSMMPREYWIYAIFSLVLFSMRLVETQPLNSMIRYVLTLFPAFLPLVSWLENRWAERFAVVIFAGLNLFLCGQFFLWGWVA